MGKIHNKQKIEVYIPFFKRNEEDESNESEKNDMKSISKKKKAKNDNIEKVTFTINTGLVSIAQLTKDGFINIPSGKMSFLWKRDHVCDARLIKEMFDEFNEFLFEGNVINNYIEGDGTLYYIEDEETASKVETKSKLRSKYSPYSKSPMRSPTNINKDHRTYSPYNKNQVSSPNTKSTKNNLSKSPKGNSIDIYKSEIITPTPLPIVIENHTNSKNDSNITSPMVKTCHPYNIEKNVNYYNVENRVSSHNENKKVVSEERIIEKKYQTPENNIKGSAINEDFISISKSEITPGSNELFNKNYFTLNSITG